MQSDGDEDKATHDSFTRVPLYWSKVHAYVPSTRAGGLRGSVDL